MTVKERITRFARLRAKSVREFERLCGLKNGYVNSIRQSIGPDMLSRIASQFPDLNIDWLMTGVGEMTKEAAPTAPDVLTVVRDLISQNTELIRQNAAFLELLKKNNEEIAEIKKNLDTKKPDARPLDDATSADTLSHNSRNGTGK